jgi:hypothetical protein
MRLFVVTALAIIALASSARAAELHLECAGVGTVETSEMTQASAYGSNGASATGTSFTSGTEQRAGSVSVDLIDSAGRVRVPREIVPPIHMGDHDGWWDLYDVTATDTEITARFRVNPLNKPTVRISRLSGAIEIKGFSSFAFSGACRPVTEAQRMF